MASSGFATMNPSKLMQVYDLIISTVYFLLMVKIVYKLEATGIEKKAPRENSHSSFYVAELLDSMFYIYYHSSNFGISV